MRCSQCLQDNPPQAKFCLQCGNRSARTCSNCNTESPTNAKFCFECGQAVATQPTPQSRPAVPKSYTPHRLAEKIVMAKHSLEDERKQVTALFADIKGSTELIHDLDPEVAQQLLDLPIHHMMGAVHRYEGTVNLVPGGGIMALFGAPLAHCQHSFGMLHQRLERVEQARAELSSAMNLYREMEMTFWLPQTESALAQLEDDND